MIKFFTTLLLSSIISSVGYSANNIRFPFQFVIHGKNNMGYAQFTKQVNKVLLSYQDIENNEGESCQVNLHELRTERSFLVFGFAELECSGSNIADHSTMISRIINEMTASSGIPLRPSIADNDV